MASGSSILMRSHVSKSPAQAAPTESGAIASPQWETTCYWNDDSCCHRHATEVCEAMIELDSVFKYYRTRGQRKIVLDHVSLKFMAGSSYGILGVNGAGKSTMMRLLAGSELANGGRIRRSVRVSWPLGFSGGMNPRLSGRENVRFFARIYGEDIRKTVNFVEDFAEIGAYIDSPVTTYSSGMVARLAFGLSMAIDFECYLIDEVTAVGDARFAQRCREEFAKRRLKSDIIMISHSMPTIKDFCRRGIVLAGGRLFAFHDIDEAVDLYKKLNA